MITPELISKYHLFEDLEINHIKALASVAEGITFDEKKYVFHEGDDLEFFYIVVEGAIGIVHERKGKPDTIISAVGPGYVFAWSALVPPHIATASAKTLSPSWLISLNRKKLLTIFQEDCRFGYRMMQKIVQISRDRLLDARIESLVFLA